MTRPAAAVETGETLLTSVYCTSRASCWAVGVHEGSRHNSTLNQVLHWNGTRWSLVTVPSPGGSGAGARNELLAVRCLSAADCWTVGDYRKAATAAVQTQALLWNGTHWSRVPTPDPAGTSGTSTSELADVTCVTARNCWSIGSFGTEIGPNERFLNLVLHWNGKRWSLIASPSPTTVMTRTDENLLLGARCVTKTDCWAVGYQSADATNFRNDILHWNSTKWSGRHGAWHLSGFAL